MPKSGLFPVNAFAKFSRTTKYALRHYDKFGLLSPTSRGENDYRYYSAGQLAIVNGIRTMQALGMPLGEIKALKDRRTPKVMDEVYSQQIMEIEKKIAEWVRARKLIVTLQKMIHPVLDVDEQKITTGYLAAEAIVLGGLNDYSRGRDDYDALLTFYHAISDKYLDIDLNYPVWGVFSKKRIKRGDWRWPDRFYFHNPEGHDRKPAALYAIGYARGGYGQTDGLYRRMIEYIGGNGLEICGDAYEEYPLNELCISDEENYLIRVMIAVRERKYRRKANPSVGVTGETGESVGRRADSITPSLGCEPASLSVDVLMRSDYPADWPGQREALGFPAVG